jgi:signal transduction histidine kinase
MKRDQIWFWLVMALPLCAILSLGAMAYAALREQAAEENRRRLEEAVSRVRQRAPFSFAEVVQGIPEREILRFGTVRVADLPPLQVPDSAAGLESLALSVRESPQFQQSSISPGSPGLPASGAQSDTGQRVLLEGLLNAETDEIPFWLTRLMRAAVDAGDSESARRYHTRAASWPRDVMLPDGLSSKDGVVPEIARMARPFSGLSSKDGDVPEIARMARPFSGLSWKTVMWAELLLAELKAEREPTSGHIFGGAADLPVPEPARLAPLPARYQPLLRLPAFAAVLDLWKSLPARPRAGWLQVQHLRLVCFQRSARLGIAMGEQPWRAFGEALQEAAGDRIRLILTDGSGTADLALPGLTGVGFRLALPGVSTAELPFGRLYVGVAVALGMAGLAGLALLVVRRRQQEQVQGEKEWLFRQAAHDLKTPLATVRALAETLRLGRVAQPGQVESYLDKIMRECDYSAELIDSVLLLARVRTGIVEMKPERFDFCAVLRTLVDRFQPRLTGWQIAWRMPERAVIVADPGMFERVMQNLIENVVQHAGAGQDLLIIGKPAGSGRWEIGIGDRGPGFERPGTPGMPVPEMRSGTHTRSCSGLGLSLIAVILERHGSEFRVESRPGGGTLVITTWAASPSGERI